MGQKDVEGSDCLRPERTWRIKEERRLQAHTAGVFEITITKSPNSRINSSINWFIIPKGTTIKMM